MQHGSQLAVAPPRGTRRRRLGHLAGLAVFLVLVILWLWSAHHDVSFLYRDWVAFDNAGGRALGGDLTGVYRDSAGERWAYLYPPFAIPLALPLALLPYYASYVAAVVMVLIGLLGGWRAMTAADPSGSPSARDRRLVVLSTLLCAPTTLQVLVTGQYSWLYLWALAVMAAGWRASSAGRLGWAVAALALKPPLALMFLPFLVARRRWAVLGHAAAVGGCAAAVTLLWGFGPWMGFLTALGGVAERQSQGDAPIEKQVTLLGFVQVLAGGRASMWVYLPWAGLAAGTLAWAYRSWRLLGGGPPRRLVGTAVLLAVALSPRLYFYDALVLAVPAAGWYLDAATYRSRAARRMGGACLAGTGIATLLFFGWPVAATAVGPLSLLWAMVELVDLRRAQIADPDTLASDTEAGELALAR